MNKEDLLKQLRTSERYNSDIPKWVLDVIKGMPERTEDAKMEVNNGNPTN